MHFFQLCNLEHIVAYDENIRARLTLSRTSLTAFHIHVPLIEVFIEQMEDVCDSTTRVCARETVFALCRCLD